MSDPIFAVDPSDASPTALSEVMPVALESGVESKAELLLDSPVVEWGGMFNCTQFPKGGTQDDASPAYDVTVMRGRNGRIARLALNQRKAA